MKRAVNFNPSQREQTDADYIRQKFEAYSSYPLPNPNSARREDVEAMHHANLVHSETGLESIGIVQEDTVKIHRMLKEAHLE